MNQENKSPVKFSYIETGSICLITILLFVIMQISKGIYPFGDNAFIFVSDGYQQNLATLYYIWDVLHGEKSLFYDYAIAYGSNMAGMLSHFGMLSPVNLIYLFVPRNYIIESTVWTTLVRMLLMALSCRYYLRKVYKDKLSFSLVTVLSLLYSFSSWTFRYLAFFQWMDVAIVLPYCIAQLTMMLERTGQSRLCNVKYCISLALILILNIQQSFGVLIFIILFAGVYLTINIKDKEGCRQAIFRLGFYTVLAFLLSAVVFLPVAYQVTSSARTSQGNIIYRIKQIIRSCKNPDTTYVGEKNVIFSSCITYVFIIIMGVVLRIAEALHVRKMAGAERAGAEKESVEKVNVRGFFSANKAEIGFVLLNIVMVLPVFIEAVNYIWQGGEYVCFPLRTAETLVFTFANTAAVIYSKLRINQETDRNTGKENGRKITVLKNIALSLVLLLMLMIPTIFRDFNPVVAGNYVEDRDMYHYAEELHGLLNGNVNAVRNENGAKGETLLENEFCRYKNVGFTSNEPLVSGLPSGSNYMHLMTTELISTNRLMGYGQNWTRISDMGGTEFSDALLDYKYVLANEDGVEITPVKISYPFGQYLNADGLQDILDVTKEASPFDVQNILARQVLGTEIFDISCYETDGQSSISINHKMKTPGSRVYIYFMDMPDNTWGELQVNGNSVGINYAVNDLGQIGEYPGNVYEEGFLGEDPENIITITSDIQYSGKIYIAEMDEEFLINNIPARVTENVNVGKHSISFVAANDGSEDKVLFVPVNYEKGWTCYIDGKKQEISRVCGSFMGVVIPAGSKVNVRFSFISPFFTIGLILTLIGIVLVILDWKQQLCEKMQIKMICSITSFIYYCILYGLLAFMVMLTALTMVYGIL